MIDVEASIFDAVYEHVAPLVPEGCLTSMYTPEPAGLPFVYLSEIENQTDMRTADSGHHEWSCVIFYEAQVYAESKHECKAIQAALDEAMVEKMGFEKTSGQFVPNLPSPELFRIVSRYKRGVTRTGDLYRAR